MAIENVGPGGVSNSYGVRTASTEALANASIPKNVYNEFGQGLAVTATRDPATGATTLQAGGEAVALGGGVSGLEKQRQQNLSLGCFNSYELIYRNIVTHPYNYAPLLPYFQQCGTNFVRVAYPVFSAAEWNSFVFASGVPTGVIQDSDFRPEFLTRSDAVIDAMESAGVKALFCLFWDSSAACSLFGETKITGLVRGSQALDFMLRFAEWFFSRYRGRPVLAAYSFFNEQPYDVSGVANPTPDNLANVMDDLVSVGKRLAPAALATSEYVFLNLNSAANRNTPTSEEVHIRKLCRSLDAMGIHVYGYGASQAGMSFVGTFGNTTPALGPQTDNTLGFEGFEAFLAAFRSLADSMSMPLWVTECGVPTDVDLPAATTRRKVMMKALVRQTDLFMIWNAANVASPQPNQVVWQIQPDQPIGNTYLALMSSINSGRAAKALSVGAGTKSQLASLQPRFCMSGSRAATGRVSLTSVASMTSATQAVMFWARRDATYNNFENLLDARGVGSLSGFVCLAGATAATDAEYFDFRGAAGGAGNSAGRSPRFANGEWHHTALFFRQINGTNAIEVFANGLYYGAFAATSNYAGIPAGITIQILGGASSGAPISMQDVCFAPYATPEDVWSHMSGEVLPQSVLHVRADPTGIRDLSRLATPLTIGSSVVYGAA